MHRQRNFEIYLGLQSKIFLVKYTGEFCLRESASELRVVCVQAMKNNAVFRIWILFFLIVCTFSLLFLDWYNA